MYEGQCPDVGEAQHGEDRPIVAARRLQDGAREPLQAEGAEQAGATADPDDGADRPGGKHVAHRREQVGGPPLVRAGGDAHDAHRHPHAAGRGREHGRQDAERRHSPSAIAGTSSAATITPTLLPALKMPVASARSFCGNHSATALTAAGKFPDSPAPSRARAKPKPATVRARACPMAARLHTNTANASPARTPIRSMTRPMTRSPKP